MLQPLKKNPPRLELGKPDGCGWGCHGNSPQRNCDPAESLPVIVSMAFGVVSVLCLNTGVSAHLCIKGRDRQGLLHHHEPEISSTGSGSLTALLAEVLVWTAIGKLRGVTQ